MESLSGLGGVTPTILEADKSQPATVSDLRRFLEEHANTPPKKINRPVTHKKGPIGFLEGIFTSDGKKAAKEQGSVVEKVKGLGEKELEQFLAEGLEDVPAYALQAINMITLTKVPRVLQIQALCNDKVFPHLSDRQKTILDIERKVYRYNANILNDALEKALIDDFNFVEALPEPTWGKMRPELRTQLLNLYWQRLRIEKVISILKNYEIKWSWLDPFLIVKYLSGRQEIITSQESKLKGLAMFRCSLREQIAASCGDHLLKLTKLNSHEGAAIVSKFLTCDEQPNTASIKYRPEHYKEALTIVDFDFNNTLNNFTYIGPALNTLIKEGFKVPTLGTTAQKVFENKNHTLHSLTFNTLDGGICVIVSKSAGGSSWIKAHGAFLSTVIDGLQSEENQKSIAEILAEGDRKVQEAVLNYSQGSLNHVGLVAFSSKKHWDIFISVKGRIPIKLVSGAEKSSVNSGSSGMAEGSLGDVNKGCPDLSTFNFLRIRVKAGEALDLDDADVVPF